MKRLNWDDIKILEPIGQLFDNFINLKIETSLTNKKYIIHSTKYDQRNEMLCF